VLIRALVMRQKNLSWHDVAKQLAFRDESSFSHFVKSLTGFSPTELEARLRSQGSLVSGVVEIARSKIFI
jgi:AraC-like DNA-binding protein